MPTTLTLPKLSPTMEEGTIAKWLKKEGDYVEAGDLLLEIATDKATVEHTAIDSGYLRKIIVKDQETAIVNQPIAIFTDKKDESIADYKPVGDYPQALEEKAENKSENPAQTTAETPKATITRAAFQPEPALENYAFKFSTHDEQGRVKASPLAKKIAAELSLDIASVKGTGPNGRIVLEDLEGAKALSEFSFGKIKAPTELPGSFVEEALTPIKKVIATRLQESKSSIPHFYVQQTVNVDALVALRNQLSSLGIKVSYNDCIIRAASLALRKHPVINSGYNSVNNTLIRFKTIDISVAVNTPNGLITPIIRHADYKNVAEISAEMRALAKRAKAGKLDPEEYKGGSFTVSNMGMFGISSFQAIINPPQAAILAISGILDVPVVKNGAIVPGKVMNINLSADHRVIDGVEAAEFLKTLQAYLEAPVSLLI